MSIVAISETAGSGAIEIGRTLAATLGYAFADREIIEKAAEGYGEGVTTLTHATEEKPTLWERLTDTQRRYVAYVEATILEMAARDNVVLAGRASTIVLRQLPHVLAVRITASERSRVTRLEVQQGVIHEAAVDYVRRSDRERAARVRFIYQVAVDDPLLYDLVLNTDRLPVDRCVAAIRETLADDRFQSTPSAREQALDASLGAQARAALLANPNTRSMFVAVECRDAVLTLSGSARTQTDRSAVEEIVARIPGVREVVNRIIAPWLPEGPEDQSHGQFRHGDERSWGGYGGGGPERRD
jgi:cytidylate kinase